MDVTLLSCWSRGRHVSGLAQRLPGGGWEVSPTNMENIAKPQSMKQPSKALLELQQPS